MISIVKLLSLFVLILCLMPESQVTATFWLMCNKPCSTYENTVFTTDGKNCILHRNSCFLKRDSCRRRRDGLPALSILTKAECQAKCAKSCGTEKSQVCGEYAGTYTTFDNECLMLKTACENGQAIIKIRNGACPTQG